MKKTIYLQQKTPMWHFQSEMHGCCLRATEVKPKLDRFLIEKHPDDNILFRVGKTDALDYKLSFEVEDDEKYDLDSTKFTLFFGNMGDGTLQKGLVFYKHHIKMNLFSLHTGLIEYINKYLSEFFATHSFGTRQDKGFGYFFPEGENFNEAFGAKYKVKFTLTVNPYSFKEEKNKKDIVYIKLYEEIFKYIEYFHKIIRSGINENGRCYDSFLKKFVSTKLPKDENGNALIWDKPLIRHILQYRNKKYRLKCGIEKNEKSYSDEKDKINVSYKIRREYNECEKYRANKGHLYLFRDMLGLASSQDLKTYDDTIKIYEYVGKDEEETFVRFKSPIEYRPYFYEIQNDKTSDYKFNVTIYINYDESGIEDMKKHLFYIESDHTYSKKGLGGIKNVTPYKNFYLKDYFDFIYKEYCDCCKSNRYIDGSTQKRSAKDPKKTKKADEYINDIFNPFHESFSEIKKK